VTARALMIGLTMALAGCVVMPAKATIVQTGSLPAAAGGIAVAVLFSRDFSPETPTSLGREMVDCVNHGLAKVIPDIRIASEEEFARTIFGLKPGEILLRRDTIGALLTRPDIAQRISRSGLTHVILVEGATHHDTGDGGLAQVPHVWLGAWSESKRRTEFTATIIDLTGAGDVQVRTTSEGRQGLVVGVPLPGAVGWVHATESASCDALGAGVARALRGGGH